MPSSSALNQAASQLSRPHCPSPTQACELAHCPSFINRKKKKNHTLLSLRVCTLAPKLTPASAAPLLEELQKSFTGATSLPARELKSLACLAFPQGSCFKIRHFGPLSA